MLVGEAPGQQEVEASQPFVGPSGLELTRMLREAGFDRRNCYVTNVCRVRPPHNEIKKFFGKRASVALPFGESPNAALSSGFDKLRADIERINPDLIIAFGDTALRACANQSGITKWRGSVLESVLPGAESDLPPKLVPTYHPAAVLRQWSWRNILVQDLRRARRELDSYGRRICLPDYRFIVRPTFECVIEQISEIAARLKESPRWLSVDIETQRRHIDCIGIGWSKLEALCIPLITCDRGTKPYWSVEEEVEIILRLREILTHPNAKVIGQNFPYDQQYIARRWGFVPNCDWDTMTVHHSIFCLLPKGLDFQSSLYCDFHRYWKGDAKDAEGHRLSDDDQWVYNARDCVVTFECMEKQKELIASMGFPSRGGQTPQERQMSIHHPILMAMLRGVKITKEKRNEVLEDVERAIREREAFVETVAGHPLNPRSPPQLRKFFYTDMAIRPSISRKTHKPTCDEKAMESISKREPLLGPICEFINEIRSLGSHRAVCRTPLDGDDRLRCSYSIPGTDTYRFNSSSDAFGFGTNLQNITAGTEGTPEEIEALVERGILLKPNLRKLFVPDEGYTICEYDLPQADAQVVAWEAEDDELKEIFRDPDRDLHNENAITIFGADAFEPGSDKKRVRPQARQYAKVGVHAADYDVTARTLAIALGISVAMAEEFLRKWFKAHPNIKDWQNTVKRNILTQRFVENAFGYRRYCFDRIENDFKEALAWIPQSTVAIVTNTGIRDADAALCTKGVDFLLQVHDSAVWQVRTSDGPELAKEIQRHMTVPVPYDDPLIMIPDAKFSEASWGECKRRKEWL